MSSVLKVDAIQNTAGTSALTIDSGGQVALPQNDNITQFQLTSSQTVNSTTPATLTGWTQMNNQNTYGFKQVGSAISESSGVFTANKLGLYRVYAEVHWSATNDVRYIQIDLKFRPNGQSFIGGDIYNFIALAQSDSTYMCANRMRYYNFNHTNDQCILQVASSASCSLRGASSDFDTMICFEWLAPPQS